MKTNLLSASMICLFLSVWNGQISYGQDVTKDANNPLASVKSFSIHNIYSPSVCAMEGSMNTAWLRYAQPLGRVLIRASLPINSFDVGGTDKSGLGDFNVFGACILTPSSSSNQVGIGPIFTFPTATSSALGSGKWQAGVALAAYFASNTVFQCGLLATWQHSFAGEGDRNKVQAASIQPFFMWQLGKGLYLRSSAINVLDLENGNYLVPLGVGMGKVVKVDKVVFNIFAEPQFAAWHKGYGMPETQLFIGVNTQF